MASKKPRKGKRYTPEEKQRIVDFVNATNTAKGRGGATAAVKKFGVSALTIGSWIKATAAGATTKAGSGVRKQSAGQRSKLIEKLSQLDREIGTRRKELEALEAKFRALKEQL